MEFELSADIPAPPAEVYRAWLDSEGHARMTGSPATASPEMGGAFTAWDGYIEGRNLELEPGRRIVQSWRTRHFSAEEPDSRIEVILEPSATGTRLRLRHTRLPEHGDQYRTGWPEHYFEPMRKHFSR
ncbi:MAG: SRPBCC domain-containing protein [Myxococcota bacterium]|nr:SRPBCC domain-containing protein [Myxococcota bacterium]